nr:immunoglobulin light chain junction region [Macaca mulatta]
CMQALWSPSTF